jgi:TonB family protein
MLIFWMAWLAAAAAEVKPLPGNEPCPYPPQAQKQHVAGTVVFTAQVRPDGSVDSVEVSRRPEPTLDFDATVKACLARWRFEPAPAADAGLRTYEGHLRFRLVPEAETELRALMEAYAAAWNAGDGAALAARGAEGRRLEHGAVGGDVLGAVPGRRPG